MIVTGRANIIEKVSILACSVGLCLCSTAYAAVLPNGQNLPGPADISRIKPEDKLLDDRGQGNGVAIQQAAPAITAPPGVEQIHLRLKHVAIEGATAFTAQQLAVFYAPYVGKDVTLDVAWTIAAAITEHYRAAGYFLSRAYVPEQRVKDGTIRINVIEGYIGTVAINDPVADHAVVAGLIARIKEERPARSETVESCLLRLNDLPGVAFRAVLSPATNTDSAVTLTLIPSPKDTSGSVAFDNYGSRFLGPNETSATVRTSFIPMQQSTLTALSSMPSRELKYGLIDHSIALPSDLTLDINGGITSAYPGYRLQALEIKSMAESLNVSLSYQWIRQRQENLSIKGGISSKDIANDILYTPLTRDRIRAMFAGLSYDTTEWTDGYDTVNATITHGVNAFGATHKGDRNSSRAFAIPDFNKLELTVSHQQSLFGAWSLLASATGQAASGTLYSSEEFGYGGQSFGRAFDTSHIAGDSGVNGTLELRYSIPNDNDFFTLQPFGFYDGGVVWNNAENQPYRQSGSSAGTGIRFATLTNQSGTFGIALPLTQDISTPIYGNKKHYRIFLQLGQEF